MDAEVLAPVAEAKASAPSAVVIVSETPTVLLPAPQDFCRSSEVLGGASSVSAVPPPVGVR